MEGIGIIGYGSRMHANLKRLLKKERSHDIVGVYDPLVKQKDKLIKGEVKLFSNSSSLINHPKIKWIFIGSINSFHYNQIKKAFEKGKNVFSEKPFVTEIRDCIKIKKLWKKTKPNFLISYPLRYSPHYRKIKEIIESGKIGKIISLEFNETLSFSHGSFIMTDWRRFRKFSGGHLLEKCCHDFDVINYILKSIPIKVSSFGGLNFFKKRNWKIFEELKKKFQIKFREKVESNPFLSKKDIIDNQVAILQYLNGVRAAFHTNLSTGLPERRLYICGTKGTIRANVLTGEIEVGFIDSTKKRIIIKDKRSAEMHGGGDKFLIEKLNKMIKGEIKDASSLDDAIKSVITCLAIDKSREKGKVISLKKIWKRLGYLV